MKKLIRNDAEEKKCVTGHPQEDVSYAKKWYKGMKKLIRNDAEEKKCVTGYSQEDVGYAKNGTKA